jgi:acetyltransferase-like isoleucine patch superfamily enzyme
MMSSSALAASWCVLPDRARPRPVPAEETPNVQRPSRAHPRRGVHGHVGAGAAGHRAHVPAELLPFDDKAGRAQLFERILGRPLPARTTIYPPFYTDDGLRLELGERVFVNQNCTFLDYAGIRLAERVMVGPKVAFVTVGHPVDPVSRREWLSGGPIDVAENVWIGAGATILPGVSIGRDAVIAAGAVVADDVPAASLVAGPKATVRRRWEAGA